MNHTDMIESLDLGRVQQLLVIHSGMETGHAMEAIDLYKKFLYLKLKYKGEMLVPSKLVDEAWHCHILDTHSYVQDCKTLFGSYLHHDPFPASASKSAGWLRTKELFQSEFGVSLDNITVDSVKVSSRCS